MEILKNIGAVALSLSMTFAQAQDNNKTKSPSSYLRDAVSTKTSNSSTNIPINQKSNMNIAKYAKYNLPIAQERLNTRGLYGYDVPTVYTDPKTFGDGKFGIAAFAEWYVDDEESPLLNNSKLQQESDKEYEEIYGSKDYYYTIYNGIYLDYYVNEKITLTAQVDMYPYSKKIYFPDHFGFWGYLTYNF